MAATANAYCSPMPVNSNCVAPCDPAVPVSIGEAVGTA